MKVNKKYFQILSAVLFALSTGSILFYCFAPVSLAAPNATRNADGYIIYKPQVEIPGEKITIQDNTRPIGIYIRNLYNYATGVVGILAVVVMMFGGIVWITAFGNTSRIGEAKAWIGAALTGLLLALTSFMILETVNPALVSFKVSNIPTTKEMTAKYTDNCSEKSPRWGQCGDKNGDGGWCRPLVGDTCEKGCICDSNYEPPNYVNTCKGKNECTMCIDEEGKQGSCQYGFMNGIIYCRSAAYGCCSWSDHEGDPICGQVTKAACNENCIGTKTFVFSYSEECKLNSVSNKKQCYPK